MNNIRNSRIMKELGNMGRSPPWGITCNVNENVDSEGDDSVERLEAVVLGPRDSPYERGAFRLSLDIPERYPFEPPQVKFLTPVYHPNIDKVGRICLDLLKMPPTGAWRPTVSLESLLLAIQTLLRNPNPEDPLMLDIARQYKTNYEEFVEEARQYTQKHAVCK